MNIKELVIEKQKYIQKPILRLNLMKYYSTKHNLTNDHHHVTTTLSRNSHSKPRIRLKLTSSRQFHSQTTSNCITTSMKTQNTKQMTLPIEEYQIPRYPKKEESERNEEWIPKNSREEELKSKIYICNYNTLKTSNS